MTSAKADAGTSAAGSAGRGRVRLGILTISDAGARGERRDASGDAIAAWAAERGYAIAARALVPDESEAIAAALRRWADDDAADLVLTTGGTGLTARDVTPEATRGVLDKEAPGIAEALRYSVYPRFPRAALSRGVAGVRGRTLVINLPGSPGGVRDGLAVLSELVEHAVDLVRGARTDH
ncbi:MAG TPA: MogA/MoaB family molybdenum cofactor biosynthesis protein [Gemmatimonadales bacterium]|nr:MogA/MoaB family molybdenum cofactor biosynthesis protein [Gemmatimonadales bacterium]